MVETKVAGDASAEELAISEVNSGIYAFDGGALLDALERSGPRTRRASATSRTCSRSSAPRGAAIATFAAGDPAIVLGVNDRLRLAAVREEAQRRIQERHMLAGVTIVAPASTSIDIGGDDRRGHSD